MDKYIERELYRVPMTEELIGNMEPWEFYNRLTAKYMHKCFLLNRNKIGFDMDIIGSRFYLDIVIAEQHTSSATVYHKIRVLNDSEKELVETFYKELGVNIDLNKVRYLGYCSRTTFMYDYYAEDMYNRLER
jgi:hypothetical protein